MKSKKKKRKSRSTPIDENEIVKWDDITPRFGVSVILARIAEQVKNGYISSLRVTWDGGESVSLCLDDERGEVVIAADLYCENEED